MIMNAKNTKKSFNRFTGAMALCLTGCIGSLSAVAATESARRETTATASSSRHTDPAAAAKAGTVHFMGAGMWPLLPRDAGAVLDGDSTTLWWSAGGGEQDLTIDFGYPWEVRSVEIEWGSQFPSDYEIQWTADGKS